jgi:hypothetical protein
MTLYPLAKPFSKVEEPLWVGHEEEDALFGIVVKHVLTLDKALALKHLDEDTMISNFMQIFTLQVYGFNNTLRNMMRMNLMMKTQCNM